MNTNQDNSQRAFQEHNEYMRGSHSSHASVILVNTSRYGRSAILERTHPVQVNRTMMEAGESQSLISMADWSSLVPVLKVTQYKLSRN